MRWGDATWKEIESITGAVPCGAVSPEERSAGTARKRAERIARTRKAPTRPSVAATKDVPELTVSVPEFHVGPQVALLGCGGACPGALEVYVLEDLVLRDGAALRRRPHVRGDGNRQPFPEGLSDDEPRLDGLVRGGIGRLDGELVQADDVPEPLLHPPRVGPEDDRRRLGGGDRPPRSREGLRADAQGQQADDVVLAVRRVGREIHLVLLQRSRYDDGNGHVPFFRLRPEVEPGVVAPGVLEFQAPPQPLVPGSPVIGARLPAVGS